VKERQKGRELGKDIKRIERKKQQGEIEKR
jgi:hypothetical protein